MTVAITGSSKTGSTTVTVADADIKNQNEVHAWVYINITVTIEGDSGVGSTSKNLLAVAYINGIERRTNGTWTVDAGTTIVLVATQNLPTTFGFASIGINSGQTVKRIATADLPGSVSMTINPIDDVTINFKVNDTDTMQYGLITVTNYVAAS